MRRSRRGPYVLNASVSTHAMILLLSGGGKARAGRWCPAASNLTRRDSKMRQTYAAALVLCTASAFAPQQHATRAAVKLYSSVKPTAGISFYEGLYEPDVPDVKLTRWRCSVRTRGLRSDRVVPDRGVTRRKRGHDDAIDARASHPRRRRAGPRTARTASRPSTLISRRFSTANGRRTCRKEPSPR